MALLLSAGLMSDAQAQFSPLELSRDQRSVDLGGWMAWCPDPLDKANIEDLAPPQGASRFQPLPGNLVIGYARGAIWLAFALRRADNAPAQWWLEVDRPSLDQVTLYSQTSDGAWRAEEQGDNRPWTNRAVRARTSVFVLNLPEGRTRTYYLRVASSGSMNLNLRLWQPAAFVGHASITLFLMGGFAFAALVMVLINLIQWLSLRERLYFTYALYILAEAVLLLALEGVYHFLVAPERPQAIEAVISLLHPLFIALMALVFRAVVRLDHHLPRIDRLYRRLAWGLIALGALSVALGFDAALKPWLWYVLLLEMLCNLALATWLAFHGNRQARLYLLAFSAFIAGTLYAILAALGFYENRFGSNAPVMVGVLVHMILMQLTVNEHTYAAKRAHDTARERALRAERRATSGLNREVATRTQELRAANLRLEQEIADRARLAQDLAESHRQLEQAFALEQAATREQRAFLHMVGHEFRTPLAVIDSASQLLAIKRPADTEQGQVNEFRTPLAVIDSASQLLAIKRPADTEQGQVIARIRRGVARLSSLFDNFLATGRLDDGGMTLNPTRIQVETIADWIREQATLMSPRHPFVLELDPGLTTLEADLQLLHVLLSNLVSNAIKFSPPETEVTLRLARQDAHCRIEVIDRGSGIPAEEQPLLFQKFRRGRAVANIPGLGLGLSVVARIVALHGGTLVIDSHEGAGTCVIVEIPLRSSVPSTVPIPS